MPLPQKVYRYRTEIEGIFISIIKYVLASYVSQIPNQQNHLFVEGGNAKHFQRFAM